jgi:two-component system, NarL family, response regulator YdfI
VIRVLIQAPSPVVKAGLNALLRAYPQIEVVEDISENAELSEGAQADSLPDVILAEAEDGEAAEEVLEKAGSSVPVILLVRDPPGTWASADRSRVRAVLPDDASAAQIAAAIEAVAVGLSVFDPETVEQLPPVRSANGVRGRLPETLTPRELEVLRAMADGLANKEIAARLGVSENTVKFHVASVMGKLGASSRTEAVMVGVRLGIVLI